MWLVCGLAAAACNQTAEGPPDAGIVSNPDAATVKPGDPDGPDAATVKPGNPDAPDGYPGPADPDAGPSEVVTPCPLARLGGLDSLAGAAVGVGPDSFLVVTGKGDMDLHLVSRAGATLAKTRLPVFVLDGYQILAQGVDEGVMALGQRGERSLSLVSITPATDSMPAAIDARGSLDLDGQLYGLSGHGKRLWLCTRDFFNGPFVSLVDVSNPDAPMAIGGIRLPADCGSIAAADDGKRVYVNATDGVRFVDTTPLDTGGQPTLSDVISPSAGVSTSAGYLVLRGASTVRVLRQSDLTEVASVPASGVLAATIAGGRLLLEGMRIAGSGMEGFVALWDVLGAAPPARLDEVILMTTTFTGDPPPSFTSAVTLDGSAVITKVRIRSFDLTRGRLDEVRLPALTPLDQLAAAGSASSVRAFGYADSALVDVSDPLAPSFAGGGSFGVPGTYDLALDETTSTPRLIFASHQDDPAQATIGRSFDPDPLPITHFRLDGDARPQIAGSFKVPNAGPALLLVAGDAIYRLRLPVIPGFDVRLQGFALASVGTAGELAQPSLDITLSPSPPLVRDPKSGSGNFGAFDVDPQAHLAVVVTGTSNTNPGVEAALFWIDLAPTPPRVIEQVRLTELPRHVRVSGTRAVGVSGLGIQFFELGRGQVSRVSSGESYLDNILSFDGRVVYYAQWLPYGLGMAGFGMSGLPPAPLPLGEPPQSLVATERWFVVGLPSELVTVEPRCN